MLVDLAAYQPNRFERHVLRWLRMVQQAQPDAKVVLVGTKVDLMTQGQAGLKCQDIMAQIGHAEEEEKQRLRAQLHRAEITLEVTKQMLAGSSAPRKSSSMARNMLAKALRLSRKASESLQDDGLAAAAGKSIEMLEASAENLRSLLERRLKLPSEVVAVSTKTMGNYKRLTEVLAAAVADKASFARIGLKVPGYYDELQHQINSRKTTTPSMQCGSGSSSWAWRCRQIWRWRRMRGWCCGRRCFNTTSARSGTRTKAR